MKTGGKFFIRLSTIFIYITFFLGSYLALYVYLGNTITVQDSRDYNTENNPEYFPMIIGNKTSDAVEDIEFKSLSLSDYTGENESSEQTWYIYQTFDGQPEIRHQLPQAKGVFYQMERLSDKRVQVTISVEDGNTQRISTYIYEVEDNKAYPRSYVLSSTFGENFSPLPFLVMIWGLLIYISEKFLVKRLLKGTS